MQGINSVIIAGEVTRPAELKTTTSGFNIARFSIRHTEAYRRKDGQAGANNSYFNVAVMGQAAPLAARQCIQGAAVVVAGSLKENRWQSPQTGEWMGETVVEAKSFTVLPPANAAPAAGQAAMPPPGQAAPPATANAVNPPAFAAASAPTLPGMEPGEPLPPPSAIPPTFQQRVPPPPPGFTDSPEEPPF